METLKSFIKNTWLEQPAKIAYKHYKNIRNKSPKIKNLDRFPINQFTITPIEYSLAKDLQVSPSQSKIYFLKNLMDANVLQNFTTLKGYHKVAICGEENFIKKISLEKQLPLTQLLSQEQLTASRFSLDYDAIILLERNKNMLTAIRRLVHHTNYSGDIIISSIKDSVWPTIFFESPNPIFFHFLPWTGTMSIQHPLERIFAEIQTPITRFVPHPFNMRYIRWFLRSVGDLSKISSPIPHLPDGEWEIQDRIYETQEAILDYNEAIYTHEWMDFTQFKDPECRHVILLRDPRDIIATVYIGLANYYIDKDPEKILLDLMDGGRVVNFINGSCGHYPSVKRIMGNYLHALDMPTAYLLRFEKFISNELFELKKLLNALGKYPHPFLNLSDTFLTQALKLGSYEYQSNGTQYRGMKKHTNPINGKDYLMGVPGNWRSCFTHKAVEKFKQLAGDGLVRLGYEKDNNWGI